MVEFLNEIDLIVPSCCDMILTVSTSIHVNNYFALIPSWLRHW
jgi:hypothetical protein